MEKKEWEYNTIMGYYNLDTVVERLQKVKCDDVNYYFDFLGHRLYSDTVTLECAYKEVYNITREEYREKLKMLYEESKRRQEEEIKEFIEKAKRDKVRILESARKVIPEDKMPIFENVLPSVNCFRFGYDEEKINKYLEIIKKLNTDNFDLGEVKEMFSDIEPITTPDIYLVLDSIKELSIHGDLLYNEYPNIVKNAREIIEEINELKERYSLKSSEVTEVKEDPILYEQKLDNYDCKIVTLLNLSYNNGNKSNTSNK